jgi:hypothetical protein
MPGDYMPVVPADFGGAVKGKRTVESLRDAVNVELARAKIAANELADRMEANIKTVDEWAFLLPDLSALANLPAEHFANLLAARVASERWGTPLLSVYTAATMLRSTRWPVTVAAWRVPAGVPSWAVAGIWRVLDRVKLGGYFSMLGIRLRLLRF